MTNIIRAKYKRSRRCKASIHGLEKDAFHKRNYRPGQHGQNPTAKNSDYGEHLRAKQMLKAVYGRISETQFENVVKLAIAKSLVSGNNIADIVVGLLESRIDIVIFRMNIAPTIHAARQFVSHGIILVNGKVMNIPSARLKPGDTITVKEKLRSMQIINNSLTRHFNKHIDYLSFTQNTYTGVFKKVPALSEVPYSFNAAPLLQLVIEHIRSKVRKVRLVRPRCASSVVS